MTVGTIFPNMVTPFLCFLPSNHSLHYGLIAGLWELFPASRIICNQRYKLSHRFSNNFFCSGLNFAAINRQKCTKFYTILFFKNVWFRINEYRRKHWRLHFLNFSKRIFLFGLDFFEILVNKNPNKLYFLLISTFCFRVS